MKQPSRVLVVDDKEAARESLQLLLDDFDCIFLEAEDGATALELIRASEFDVIFLDLRLPDLHGIEVLRQAKTFSGSLGKVIIVTGLPDRQTREEARTLGAFRYLTKPLDYDAIREAFAEATSDSALPPLPTQDAGSAPTHRNDPPFGTTTDAQASLPRLLILDDSEAWLETMQEELQNDFDISRTTDAEEAIAWVRNERFALIILDMRLTGGISGLDVLKRMRRNSPNLRAIILTGHLDHEIAMKSAKQGAIDYVLKSQLATLNDTVKSLVGGSTMATNSPSERMRELAESINAVHAEMHSLITSNKEEPALTEALAPLREKLRILQELEAKEIAERYGAHFKPLYDEGQDLIQRARRLLGGRK